MLVCPQPWGSIDITPVVGNMNELIAAAD